MLYIREMRRGGAGAISVRTKGPDRGQGMLQQTLSRKLIRLAAVALLAGSLAACASDDKPEYVERPVDDLYNTAMSSLMAGNYNQAAEQFDEVERQHPYSIWATKAQLLAAYSHYEADNYDDAIIGLDRFIQLHPSNKDAPYAYYLRALTYYEQITDVGRDQRMTQLALNALDEVVRRYPNTEYARDARLKLDLARDHLAGKEMSVGRFYLKRGQYLAAINRFQRVVDDYQTTTHVPEALHRMVEAYTALGIDDQARRIAAVLGHNYPGSRWYADTYYLVEGVDLRPPETDRSWVARTWDSVF